MRNLSCKIWSDERPLNSWLSFIFCISFLAVCWFPSSLTAATTLELPLSLRPSLLQNSLANYFNPDKNKPTVLYKEGSYRYLYSENPRLYIRDNRPHFSTHIIAQLGVNFLGIWPIGMKWNGYIDMTLSPYVDEQWQLRYHIDDSAIFDSAGGKPMVMGVVWKLAKRFLHPHLEKFGLDLRPPQQEIFAFLRACSSPAELERVDAALNSIVIGKVRINNNGIVVPLILTVPGDDISTPTSSGVEKPLNSAELTNFQKILEPWDAFIVFIIKSAGADFVDATMRAQLLDLLLGCRYQLLPILDGEIKPDAADPLRALFVDAWKKLGNIIEGAEERGLIQEKALRYMTFVNAGDALLTLDAAVPRLGMQVTTDGLRRLARTLQPDTAGDPLYFDWEVDPALRDLFHFDPEPPAPPEEEKIIPVESPPSVSYRLLQFFLPSVYADQTNEGRSLERWVPLPEELDEYQERINKLLQSVTNEVLERSKLDSRYEEIFRYLVPSTALIESCWRQFVLQDGQITYLRSNAGSIGLMQINQNVWRGFYNLDRLRWEVGYNIKAGSQILMLYMKQYGIPLAVKSNNQSYAPRATYSVYNAGPSAVKRFMKKDTSPREKRVDGKFQEIYQKFEAGGRVDLSACDVDVFQTD